MSSEVEAGSEAINWEAVAKALGVPVRTLPIVKSRNLEAETTATVVPQVAGEVVKPVRHVAGDYALTDAEWTVVEASFPRGPGGKGKRDREFINACIFRHRTLGSGREWASSPEAAVIPLKTLAGRYLRFCMNRWWEQLAAAVEASDLSESRKREFRAMSVEATKRREKVLALRAS